MKKVFWWFYRYDPKSIEEEAVIFGVSRFGELVEAWFWPEKQWYRRSFLLPCYFVRCAHV